MRIANSRNLQKQWLDYLVKKGNPDLYFKNNITKHPKQVLSDLDYDSAKQSIELEIIINYVFNKYCEITHQNPTELFKMHSKLSHKELLLSLINQGNITIDCLPTNITIEDLINQLLSEISPQG